MKIVELGKFLKIENLTEIVSELCQPRSRANSHTLGSLLEFRGIFCF